MRRMGMVLGGKVSCNLIRNWGMKGLRVWIYLREEKRGWKWVPRRRVSVVHRRNIERMRSLAKDFLVSVRLSQNYRAQQ